MRHNKTQSSLVLVVIIIHVVLSLTITKCDNDSDDDGKSLIKETCQKTPHYELCVSSLESTPKSSEADLRGLAKTMFDTVLAKASETLDLIRSLLKKQNPNSPPELEKSLAYCAELYIPMVKYSLPQAIEALVGSHFGFANYGIADAAKQANACDKNITAASSSAADEALADRNALLNDLSEVAAAIVMVLIKGS